MTNLETLKTGDQIRLIGKPGVYTLGTMTSEFSGQHIQARTFEIKGRKVDCALCVQSNGYVMLAHGRKIERVSVW